LSFDGKAIGRLGEDAACAFLEKNSFEIVERNWRVRAGEIDIIARRAGLTVIAEVKARTNTTFGEPEEAVTRGKAHRLRMLASEYLSGIPEHGEIRFDVIAVMLDRSGAVTDIKHIPDAF